ncbi:MAG TPA: MBL fold metallo-hydrolase [Thermoplasmata archaeon]|nr:MBL fold metallo-hydrolase [Thermoplasmata archaeon]
MPSASRLTVLDGESSVGGTKILLDTGSAGLLLDFGTNYKRMGQYYEEFLHPRPARGITDLLAVGLLPERRGLYRPDLLPTTDFPRGDADFPGEAPAAVLLTHAHLDHCGALAFLDPTIPIYATPASVATLRAVQESGKSDVTTEFAYYTPRVDRGDGLLATERKGPRSRRAFHLFGEFTSGLVEALRAPPARHGEFEGPDPASAAGDPVTRAFRIESFPVDHSLLGSAAFVLDVDGARVAYTGDVRFHGARGRETEAFLRAMELRHPDVLLVEGTRLRRSDADHLPPQTSEAEVRANATAKVREYGGRLVIADFGPRNIERLTTFREVARESDRQLVVTAKDAYLLHLLRHVDPSVPVDFGPGGMRIWKEPSVRQPLAWQERIEAAYPDASMDAAEIIAAPGRVVLCFSFFDANDLVDLRRATTGGLWLYSSSEAHGEEQEFDFVRLQAWIAWAGLHQVGFRVDPADGRPQFEPGYHASGHATESELIDLVRRAQARVIVPVHSETPGRYQKILGPEGAKVRLLRAGEPLEL